MKIRAIDLVFDETIYPRNMINEIHVNEIAEALRMGMILPPPVIDKKTNRIADGWHRVRSHIKVEGEETTIDCDVREFKSDKELFLFAIEANATHGLRYNAIEQTKCILRAEEMGITREIVAKAMKITVEKAEKIILTKVGITKEGMKIPLKPSMRVFSGIELNKKQIAINQYAGGMQSMYYINHLIGLIEAGIIDKLTDSARIKLIQLRDLLNEKLPAKKIKKAS